MLKRSVEAIGRNHVEIRLVEERHWIYEYKAAVLTTHDSVLTTSIKQLMRGGATSVALDDSQFCHIPHSLFARQAQSVSASSRRVRPNSLTLCSHPIHLNHLLVS
jgi:hypothetical protein